MAKPSLYRLKLKLKLKWIVSLLLLCVQVTSAAAEMVELSGSLNARKSMNFWGQKNVIGILTKGTRAQVLDKIELPSGNFGFKAKVVSTGEGSSESVKVGKTVWLYYHLDRNSRRLILLDDAGNPTDSPEQAAATVVTKPFSVATDETILDRSESSKSSETCATCASTEIAANTSPASAIPSEITSVVTKIAENETPEVVTAPLLDPGTEELATYINSLKRGQPTLNHQIAEIMIQACREQNPPVPVSLILSIMQQESGFNPRATSYTKNKRPLARGLMQIIDSTMRNLAGHKVVDPYDLKTNIRLGVQFVHDLSEKFHGDAQSILIAYNAGAGRVGTALHRLPRETQAYLKNVTRNLVAYRNAVEKKFLMAENS